MKSDNSFDWVLPVIGFTFFLGMTYLVGYIIHYDATVIDTHVETIDGKSYDCAQAHVYNNGMTDIGHPYNIQIPTKTVKLIKKLD